MAPKSPAQDSAAEATKRKVRTKVAADYPAIARQMNITGHVKIEATVAADGHVISAKPIGGSPLLVNAAMDAAKKWRYEAAPKESLELMDFVFGQ